MNRQTGPRNKSAAKPTGPKWLLLALLVLLPLLLSIPIDGVVRHFASIPNDTQPATLESARARIAQTVNRYSPVYLPLSPHDLGVLQSLACINLPQFIQTSYWCDGLLNARNEAGTPNPSTPDTMHPPASQHSPSDDQQQQQLHSCIFCQIAEKSPEGGNRKLLYEDADFVAFHDINPSAQQHILVIPRSHIDNIYNLTAESLSLLDNMTQVGHTVLNDLGVKPEDRQFGFHVPPFTSVPHLHMHGFGKPFKNWLRTIKYPSSYHGCRWWIDMERLRSSIERAKAQSLPGTWSWSWTSRV
ncbi:HIT-like domain-containing protein [Polychytrium aggregatum]|uniref:HIT-like domain-containing protein n=1 Tax=Polychytrium aggregatum TaxID=110093 RepID=UPI0022FE7DB9|nr:HIT-like domain-containing protein [Polychytrium aggregatum]KAI9206806.1 HIT-like domain-containing protein [Polychytrium aggregatum]